MRHARRVVAVLFGLLAAAYLGVGAYFLIAGVGLGSAGSILLGLACLSGVALFLTPLWLMRELRRQTELLRLQQRTLARMGPREAPVRPHPGGAREDARSGHSDAERPALR